MTKEQEEKKLKISYERIKDAYKKATTTDFDALETGFLLKQILDKNNLDQDDESFCDNSVFGFNIRLNQNDAIIPLLDGKKWWKYVNGGRYYDSFKEIVYNQIDRDKTIPVIFGDKIREIVFQLEQDEDNKIDADEEIDEEIKKALKEKKSFAVVQKKELFNDSNPVYFWISRECDDLESKTGYLSNILVISSDKSYIEYAKKHHLDFIRFLFKLETAYALILEDEREKEAIKSAKAAIMSRNMSHNLGSHVMFYIKQKLESAEKILETGVLKNLVESNTIDKIKEKIDQKVNFDTKERNQLPFLVGLGRFINYLQERQDYIATIATDYIPSNSTVNFKDNIYDELKPDLRTKRHSNEKEAEAIGRKASNLLLDYIAFSEGFNKSEKIVLEFPYDNKIEGRNDYFNGEGLVPSGLREMNVALPGGTLGRQAFFSIMENIIRNAAKHDGEKANNGKLVFRFDVLNEVKTDENFYFSGKDNYDNADKVNSTYTAHANDYYYLGITVVLNQNAETTVQKIGKSLNQEYLRDDRQMDEKCKGIKEIRLSAAWLRGESLDTSIPSDEPPAVSVRCADGNLQYIICLAKPKRVAFVVKSKENIGESETKLLSFDCQCFAENGLDCNKIANYEMVVIDKDVDEKNKESIRKKIGSRVFDADDATALIEDCANGKYDSVYKEWLKCAFKLEDNNMPQISILDDKARDKSSFVNVGIPVFVGGTSTTDNQCYNDCIVFTTHYEGQPKIKSVDDKKRYAQARYVEGISGGNSTDRFIRNDRRDYGWYAKHVAAALTKVAIFDERIYSSIMPVGEVKEAPEETRQDYIKKFATFFTENQEASVSGLGNYLKETFEIANTQTARDLKNTIGWGTDKAGDYADAILKIKGESEGRDFSAAWKYREKGIWVYNIRIAEENQEKIVEIIGYNAPTASENNQIGLYSDAYTEAVIGKIKKIQKTGELDVEVVLEQKMDFDFISIHQGVLDKIYGALFNNVNEKDKVKVTKRLFEKFSRFAEKNTNDDFLPQFVIHSGRSKPSKEDMPQEQPFIQFAALDHAVKDCKLTLTELLYSAHYESTEE